MKPEFVDNRGDNTLHRSLRVYLDWLKEHRKKAISLSISTGYFNPGAYFLLADQLEELAGFRLLLGAEPQNRDRVQSPRPGDPVGPRYDETIIKRALVSAETDLKRDRDLLGFSEELEENLQRFIRFLKSDNVQVRRYESRFLHGKAFLFHEGDGVLCGSSNFTYAGLSSNLELNLGHYQPTVNDRVAQWFEDLWEESSPYDLAEIYEARFEPYSPYLIYLRVLWERYGSELEEERPPETPIQLTTFQNDGVWRSERILDRYHGVIVADGVGLGKTYIAGELLRRAVKERRQRALVIAPAALRDGMWRSFKDRYQLYFECVSYEQLANEKQLGGGGYHLLHSPDDYATVVIDEAQAFRNPSTKRSQALRTLLQGIPPKDLILLTATPVNNTLWDLYYLLALFMGHDAVFAGEGIPSLKERFAEAQAADPYKLSPNLLFDVLDKTTVRRTRHFVSTYYPNDTIRGPDGRWVHIRFPEPSAVRVDYTMTEVLSEFLPDFAEALAPPEGEPAFTLARYLPSKYSRIDKRVDASQLALVGLIRTALLKRFESSVHALRESLRNMIRRNDAFLEAINVGYIPLPAAIEEWSETDSEEVYKELLEEMGSEDVSGYDTENLSSDVKHDNDLLREWLTRFEPIAREDDPKLNGLRDTLGQIVESAEKDGRDPDNIRQNRKVVIFSFYEDTVRWILGDLLTAIEEDERFACYKNRIVAVVGDNGFLSPDGEEKIPRSEAVWGFAPISTEAPKGREDRFDILISTDVLAEGENLQQCRNIINYDLPWNPMRVVQRNGRIDRLLSPHTHVFAYCFFPAKVLDELLELEHRVRRKLAQAAATIGVETKVIPGIEPVDRNFTERKEQIEKLRDGESDILIRGTEDTAIYSGEEYRQELRKGLIEQGKRIKALPWGAGSGMSSDGTAGHFFCARVGDHVYMRFVPIDEGEEIVKDTLTCLRLISCFPETNRYLPDDLRQAAYGAWERARKDIYKTWMFQTDPKNIEPEIRPLFRKVAQHLRDHPPPDMEQRELENVLDAVEAPWGRRYERELREILNQENFSAVEKSKVLVEKVRELGMRPFKAPEPLPKIDEDFVKLVCWLAIRHEGSS